MRKCKLRQLAESDLEEIWLYTYRTRGAEQADKYTRQLYERFQWLADRPQIDTQRNKIKEGYRSFLSGSHIIFYCIADENTIEIIGLTGPGMEIERHISNDPPL